MTGNIFGVVLVLQISEDSELASYNNMAIEQFRFVHTG